MKFILLLILTCSIALAQGQNSFPRTLQMRDYSEKELAHYREQFGVGKVIPPKFELQCLLALSRYPELADKKVDFVFDDIGFTMSCKPYNRSFFQKGRHYKISIDNDANGFGVILDSVPFNGQVGVIGHEIAHIADYEKMTELGIIATGMKYLFKRLRPKIEKRVDGITIKHGLGWQLYDWADFVMFGSIASSDYKEYKVKTYLQPKEIEQLIQE